MEEHRYKYKATFTSLAKVVPASEEEKFVAKASLAPLRGILPADFDPKGNPDMLYIVCNGALGGLVNKNDDAISGPTALLVHSSAKNKYISTDHDRAKVVGVILHTGLSKFGTNEPLTDEQAASMKEPFNMSFAGVVWKVIAPMVAKYLVNTGDDLSQDALSMSWEIAFDQYGIGVGSDNLYEAGFIGQDDPLFPVYDKYLRANRGSGKDPQGKKVYRIVTGDPVILGYSIVTNPAAEVKGILPVTEANEMMPAEEKSETILEVSAKKVEKNITTENPCVKIHTTKAMKIQKIEDIAANWDEFAKDSKVAVAAIADFVDAITKNSEKFAKELEAKENLAKAAEENKVAAEKRSKELETSLAEIRKELADVRAAAQSSEAMQKFNERMASFDAKFDLDQDDRKLIASDVKPLTDETFASYMAKCEKLMGGKLKKAKASDAPMKDDKKCDDDKDEDDAKALFNDSSKKSAADDDDADASKKAKDDETKAAFASVKEDTTQAKLPNTVMADASLGDAFKLAFGDSFKIDGKSVNEKKSQKNKK